MLLPSAPPALPFVTLCTARLTLRPYRAADAAGFLALIEHNREHLRPAFPSREAAVADLTTAQTVLANFAQDWQTQRLFVFGIWNTSTSDYLGDISLKPKWGRSTSAEISYYLGAEHQGHGYAREALQAVVQFGFGPMQAHRLDIRCYADNVRSHTVATDLGFRRLAGRGRLWPIRREPPDIYHFALTRPADIFSSAPTLP